MCLVTNIGMSSCAHELRFSGKQSIYEVRLAAATAPAGCAAWLHTRLASLCRQPTVPGLGTRALAGLAAGALCRPDQLAAWTCWAAPGELTGRGCRWALRTWASWSFWGAARRGRPPGSDSPDQSRTSLPAPNARLGLTCSQSAPESDLGGAARWALHTRTCWSFWRAAWR